MSSKLFEKIITKNQIINGKLNVNERILKKIYNSLNKNSQILENKKIKQENLIKQNIKKLNNINFEIKKILESFNKVFKPSIGKISLLYKKVGDIFYIKARFYWHGKQREVQIGSIPSVISTVNNMIDRDILKSIKPFKNYDIKWEAILKNPKLVDAIKEIAIVKSQEYILRQLVKKPTSSTKSNLERNKDKDLINDELESINQKLDYSYDQTNLNEEENWYDRWRKENL